MSRKWYDSKSLIMKPHFKTFHILIVLILIGVCLIAGYFYFQYQKTQKLLQNPTLAAQEEVKGLVSKVAAIIELPKDETPTVATISDKNKLKDQPFFINAQNGDKVLIYTNAKKAIIYRPSTNKIIEVGPVNLGSQAPVSPTIASEIKVALYNGTSIVGLTTIVEKDLKSKMDNVSVVIKENAKESYAKTLVIDLSGNQKQNTEKIAQIFGAEMRKLPQTETRPANTDILVILGK